MPHTPGPQPDDAPVPGVASTAAEDPEESVAHEREVVGDQPDTGGLVPPDRAQ